MAPPITNPLEDREELRRRAEKRVAEKKLFEANPSPEKLPALVHELQVHQIQLEMQNEALREAQIELQISHNRYSDLYDFAPIGYMTLDECAVIREINLTACNILGRERRFVLGRPVADYLGVADRDRFMDFLADCRNAGEGKKLSQDVNVACRRGIEIPVQACVTHVADPHTGRGSYFTAILDLTELRRREAEARDANRQLAELLDSITDAFVSFDCDWHYVYANDQACRLLHKSREELIGSVLWDLFPEVGDLPQYEPLTKAMRDRVFVEFQAFYPPLDAWFSCRCYPSSGGLSVCFQDITDQKLAAERLRESENRLRLALEAGQMGLWHCDVRDGQAVWNAQEFELLGLAPQESQVEAELFFKFVHPEDLPGLQRELAAVFDDGTEFRRKFRVIREDGEIRWLSSLGRLSRDPSGHPLSMIGVNYDITETKCLEATLNALNEDLEAQVMERTAALALLRDIATVANRSQDIEDALRYCLRRVAEHNGWCFGHALLPSDEAPDQLLPAYVWYSLDAERFEAFRKITLDTTFRRACGLPGRVFERGEPEWSNDLREELGAGRADLAQQLGIATAAAFPIMVGERVVGVLEFFAKHKMEPGKSMLETMANVGTQLGRVIERKLFQSRLLTIADEQQRRLGQDLHDDIGQELTGLALKAETLAENLATDDSRWSQIAAEVVDGLNRVQRKARTLAHTLIPMDIEAPILEPALEELASRTDRVGVVSCRFRRYGNGRVADSQTATQLLRIAQEAVANAVQHAEATQVEIELKIDKTTTILGIRDDGRGLSNIDRSSEGMGLRIMQHRAGLIGATLTAETLPAGGTQVTCRVTRKRF